MIEDAECAARNPAGWPVKMRHLDGVAWHDAPVPDVEHGKRAGWRRRVTPCWAQTEGWSGLDQIWRCACGAISINGRPWQDRNSRANTEEAR